uniref:nitric-oxide synthase (NADPH) n=1 Tax=Trichogramma kaykai TaxID=54128 RepID=A0ABD2W544_9HYME
MASSRLESTVKRLEAKKIFELYNEVFQGWLNDKIIEIVPREELGNDCHYLPHRPVLKEGSKTKIRPVFDASACVSGNVSLNNCVEKGPNLVELLPIILNRFRENEIGVISDIKKAFLQIEINKKDRDYLRFLWKLGNKYVHLRHRRVVFGLACSPFLLAAVLELHFNTCLEKAKNETSYVWTRETIKKLKSSFYVDNCVTSVKNEDALLYFRREAKEILRQGGFDLYEWEYSRDSSTRSAALVLGIEWDKQKDTLRSITLMVEVGNFPNDNIQYNPGDHLGVFPCNNENMVDNILRRLENSFDFDTPIDLQIQKQVHTPNGIVKSWITHDKYQGNSLRTLLTRFIDISNPPSPNLLKYFASIAACEKEKSRLNQLASDSFVYEDWRHWKFPNLLEVLEEFPSVKPYAPVLLLHLTTLQPRFYSISSSPLSHQNQIHLTVAVVQYETQGGNGNVHYGVCSNYLKNVSINETMYVFIRSAVNFNMPDNTKTPMILVGPGTGIAPFRGFWNHRQAQMENMKDIEFGKIWLFFGCRQKELDLYRNEKNKMIENKVLDREFLALSREPGTEKTYVQDLIQIEAMHIYDMLVNQKGHFYVCGDCTMAEDVYQTLKHIIKIHGNMIDQEVETYMLSMRLNPDICGFVICGLMFCDQFSICAVGNLGICD